MTRSVLNHHNKDPVVKFTTYISCSDWNVETQSKFAQSDRVVNVDEKIEDGNPGKDFNNEVTIDGMRCADLGGFAGEFSAEQIR